MTHLSTRLLNVQPTEVLRFEKSELSGRYSFRIEMLLAFRATPLFYPCLVIRFEWSGYFATFFYHFTFPSNRLHCSPTTIPTCRINYSRTYGGTVKQNNIHKKNYCKLNITTNKKTALYTVSYPLLFFLHTKRQPRPWKYCCFFGQLSNYTIINCGEHASEFCATNRKRRRHIRLEKQWETKKCGDKPLF